MHKFERDRTTSLNIINYSTLNAKLDWEDLRNIQFRNPKNKKQIALPITAVEPR